MEQLQQLIVQLRQWMTQYLPWVATLLLLLTIIKIGELSSDIMILKQDLDSSVRRFVADLGGLQEDLRSYTMPHKASAEIFTGTDAGIRAGNLKLTTNTNSTSNTTGDLVVAGGVGIGDDVNIGGLLDVDGTFRANSTSRFDDNIVFQGASRP
ncbi:MAG: hypothetical protein CM15mV11_0670 [Caudoviricetes sp.]|nr:MAG: hypothetical protein CM15mV11_0670 [Caudoviricetes sp.]